ncbi:centriolar coiled-coil protein of 110 kDa-like isoform X3 [Callorhinchus milii]|uniref:centriolar coiled-coil protein of 110 kDa-like isoform X3 n=1 Tax=Callorhinchus milii TaxID=7868 RepID=UPI001C3FBDAE|nr:centriolar coiled-coil protein of 110 kDa-like isoform X3 [Callorhinchus milii]
MKVFFSYRMESYEEFCKARLAQIKAKVKLGNDSPLATKQGESLIQFHGIAILPPLLTPVQRKEMQEYQLNTSTPGETSKNKLNETQINRRLLEVQNLLNSVQIRKAPSIQEFVKDCSLLISPSKPLSMSSGFIEDWNSTADQSTLHRTSLRCIESLICESISTQVSDAIKPNSAMDPGNVPGIASVIITEESVQKNSLDYNESFCTSIECGKTNVNCHISCAPMLDDSKDKIVHTNTNFTVLKENGPKTEQTSINSIDKQEDSCQTVNGDCTVLSTGNKKNTYSEQSHSHHYIDEETAPNQDSSPDPYALSLQNLLKKSREYRDRQRQEKLLKTLQCKVQSDKENETKDSKDMEERKLVSGKPTVPDTILKVNQARPSVFPHYSCDSSEPHQTIADGIMNEHEKNASRSNCQALPQENTSTEMHELSLKNVVLFSKSSKPINKSHCLRKSQLQSNSVGQRSQCQQEGKSVNRPTKSQSRSFRVPNLQLSKSPVLSKKQGRLSQRNLVNAPIVMDGETVEQRKKESRSDAFRSQMKVSQAQRKHTAELEFSKPKLKAFTGLETTLTPYCEAVTNELLLDSKATLLNTGNDKCIESDKKSIALCSGKTHSGFGSLSYGNFVPQTIYSCGTTASRMNILQSFVTKKIQCSRQLFPPNIHLAAKPLKTSPKLTSYTMEDTIRQKQYINKSYDVEFPSSLLLQDFKSKQELDSKNPTTPEFGLNIRDSRVKRRLILNSASDEQEQPPASMPCSSKVSFHLHHLSRACEESEVQSVGEVEKHLLALAQKRCQLQEEHAQQLADLLAEQRKRKESLLKLGLGVLERWPDRFLALIKGYLTRRVLRTKRLMQLSQTIKDTQQLLLALQTGTPMRNGLISARDALLKERVRCQLRAALYEVHDIFFLISSAERMQIIRHDQDLQQNRLNQQEHGSVKKKISAATQKVLERKRMRICGFSPQFNRPLGVIHMFLVGGIKTF